MTPQDTEAEITTQFPGLRVRPIGPGDDVVVSAQVLEDWLAAHDKEVADVARINEEKLLLDAINDMGKMGIHDAVTLAYLIVAIKRRITELQSS